MGFTILGMNHHGEVRFGRWGIKYRLHLYAEVDWACFAPYTLQDWFLGRGHSEHCPRHGLLFGITV